MNNWSTRRADDPYDDSVMSSIARSWDLLSGASRGFWGNTQSILLVAKLGDAAKTGCAKRCDMWHMFQPGLKSATHMVSISALTHEEEVLTVQPGLYLSVYEWNKNGKDPQAPVSQMWTCGGFHCLLWKQIEYLWVLDCWSIVTLKFGKIWWAFLLFSDNEQTEQLIVWLRKSLAD